VASGGAISGAALARGAVLAAGYVLLACWVFARVFRYAVRTGLIARYSAESVS
jgi:ABC-2 type transport system permease protein